MDTKTREGKFEEMWNLLNYKFGGVCLDQTYSDIPENKGIVIVQDLMRKVSQTLKHKTRREKLTNIIQAVYDSYAYLDRPNSSERDKIIELLVELRDKEEDV